MNVIHIKDKMLVMGVFDLCLIGERIKHFCSKTILSKASV